MISRTHIKDCTTLNYIEYFLSLIPAITVCISISAFVSLLDIPIGITSTAIELKIYVIAVGIKNYKLIIKKKKKKHEKIVFLIKSNLSSMEVLISKALIDSNISHDDFLKINNVLKEYDDMKEEIKDLKT